MTVLQALNQLVDVMRRSDPAYTQARGIAPCSDDEWDDALQQAEDVVEQQTERAA